MSDCLDLKSPNSTINLIKKGLYGLPGSIDIESKFMKDRQIAKKILHKKQKKKGRTDDEVDDDLNLIVYGTNIRKKLGASYQKYKSEIDFEDIADRMAEELEVGVEGFVPIGKDDPIFDEITKLKSRVRNSVYMIKERGKSLASDLNQLIALLTSSIPAAAALIVSIPIPNIAGALSIILLCLDSLSAFFIKLKDILPYLDPLPDIELVIQLDFLANIKDIICAALKIILGVIEGLSALTAPLSAILKGKDPETRQKELKDANDAVTTAKSDLEKLGFYEDRKEAETKASELGYTGNDRVEVYSRTSIIDNQTLSVNGYVIKEVYKIFVTNHTDQSITAADSHTREVYKKLNIYKTKVNDAKKLL